MKILVNEKLSPHKYKTSEGYLVCVDAILARTGKQTYRRSEIFADSDDDSEIEVDRTAEEVFNPKTLASFENKPVTVEHPNEDVNSENYKEYAVGFVRDVHQGEIEGQPVILGTLVIQDAKTIEEIENGEHTDLSCGYDADILDEENPQQRNIRGNHVALCQEGRAGIAHIVDSVSKVKDSYALIKYVSNEKANEAVKILKRHGIDANLKFDTTIIIKNVKESDIDYTFDMTDGIIMSQNFQDNSIKDSLSFEEIELCEYVINNLDHNNNPKKALDLMKIYYSEYQKLARDKPNDVLQYFKENMKNKTYDSIKDESYSIVEANGKWYYEAKYDNGFTKLVGPYNSKEEAIMYFRKHRPNEKLENDSCKKDAYYKPSENRLFKVGQTVKIKVNGNKRGVIKNIRGDVYEVEVLGNDNRPQRIDYYYENDLVKDSVKDAIKYVVKINYDEWLTDFGTTHNISNAKIFNSYQEAASFAEKENTDYVEIQKVNDSIKDSREKSYGELKEGDKIYFYGHKATVRNPRVAGVAKEDKYKGQKVIRFEVQFDKDEDISKYGQYQNGTYGGVESLTVQLQDSVKDMPKGVYGRYFAVSQGASETYNSKEEMMKDLHTFGNDEVKVYSLKNEKDVQNLYFEDLMFIWKDGKIITKGPMWKDSVRDMAYRPFRFSVNLPALKRAIKNKDKDEIDSMIDTLNKDIDDYNNWKEDLTEADKSYFRQEINFIKNGLSNLGYTLNHINDSVKDANVELEKIAKIIENVDNFWSLDRYLQNAGYSVEMKSILNNNVWYLIVNNKYIIANKYSVEVSPNDIIQNGFVIGVKNSKYRDSNQVKYAVELLGKAGYLDEVQYVYADDEEDAKLKVEYNPSHHDIGKIWISESMNDSKRK